MKKSLFSKIALALVLVSVSTQAFSFGLQDFRKYLATHPKAKTALSITAGLIPSLVLMSCDVCLGIKGVHRTEGEIFQGILITSGYGLAYGCLTHKFPVAGSALALAHAAFVYSINLFDL